MTGAEIKISIIMPVYNVETFIRQSIESVLNQDYTNYELILIDDGSTDKTLDICRAYSEDSRIKIICQNHGGQSKARNKGMEAAKGDYVTFLDGDDFWERGHLKKLGNILAQFHPHMCIANQYYCLKDNKKNIHMTFPVKEESACGSIAQMKKIIFYKGSIPGSMCLTTYKRDFLVYNHIRFDENLACNEDFDFFMQGILKAERVAVAGYLFYNYRQDNLTSTYRNITAHKVLTYMQVYKKWYDFIVDHRLDDFKIVLLGISNNYRWVLRVRDLLKKEDTKKYEVEDFFLKSQYILKVSNRQHKIEMFRNKIKQIGHKVKYSKKN